MNFVQKRIQKSVQNYLTITILHERINGSFDWAEDWDCSAIKKTKLKFMDVTFANPTALSTLFEAIKMHAPERNRSSIQIAALELLEVYDDYQCLLKHPDSLYMRTELLNRFLAAEEKLKSAVFVMADLGTKLSYAMNIFCTWLKISILSAIVTAIIGAAIGAGIGAAVGSFTLPILGSLPGIVAGAITGATIGAGAGLLLGGCTLGLKKIDYQSAKNTFFEQNSQSKLGKTVQDFITTCTPPK